MNRIKMYLIAAVLAVVLSITPVILASNSVKSDTVRSDITEQTAIVPLPSESATTPKAESDLKNIQATKPQGVQDSLLSSAANKLVPPSTLLSGNGKEFIYFRQNSPEFNSVPYGDKTIGSYGCGPTNMAIVISNLTGNKVSPITLARQAESWNCFVSGSGTAHAFFPKAASYYGIEYEYLNYSKQTVINALKEGKMIICTMGKGYFSRGGHYITLRGITADGKILIADTYSEENTKKEWDLDFLASQLKYSVIWVFSD